MNLLPVSIIGSVVVVLFWLVKGRKSVLDFCMVAVAVGVVVVLFIATQWGWLGPLIGLGLSSRHPSASMKHAVQPGATPTSLVPLQSLLHTVESTGGVVFALLLVLLLVGLALLSRQRRHAGVSPLCSQCGKEGSPDEYQWKNERGRVRGKLCVSCIRKLHAVTVS